MKGKVLSILFFIFFLNGVGIAAPREDRSGKVNQHSDIQKERKGSSRPGHKNDKNKSTHRPTAVKRKPGDRSPVYYSVSEPPGGKRIYMLPGGTKKMKSGEEGVYIVDDTYIRRYNDGYDQNISPFDGIEILDYKGR